jgi:phage terminase large subunit GpA-like protein
MSHLAHCIDLCARNVAPRRALTVAEWADDHRYLSGKQAGERGRWRTARTPFLREIMNCLSPDSTARDIVVMKSSQVGMTEAVVNWIGYLIAHQPGPAMVMLPTLEARDSWKIQKLNPLLQETPAVREVLGGMRSRDSANRQDLIDFPGGVLFLAGGNSTNSYAQKSVRYLVMDDLDRFPSEIGEEGDVITLARGRTKAFARPKRLFISTPTVHDESLIEREYEKSDQRRYHLECPHCGQWQPLEWGADLPHGLRWDAQHTRAWYSCRECQGEIHEHQKPALLENGRWIAAHPERSVRGYQLTALLAPIGLGPSWLDLAHEWRQAVKAPATLRAFVNTHLGETWVEQGDSIEPTGLLARLEAYPDGYPARARTFGCDVQKDRLELTLVDWGTGEEAWAVEHLILPGDTARGDVWDQLEAELADFGPEAGAIDSGYNTSMVYAYCQGRPWIYATKGVAGGGRPLIEDARSRRQRLRRQRRKGIAVHVVGVDQAKALLFSRLKIQQPGPGYIHFPNEPAFDDEYFAQLTAEKLVTKMRGTRPIAQWVQTRPRNEALDCFLLALAALRLAEIDLSTRGLRRPGTAAPRPETKIPPPARRAPAPPSPTGFGSEEWSL